MAPWADMVSVVARWPSGPISSSASVTALAAACAMAPLSLTGSHSCGSARAGSVWSRA